ncbi:NAD(P)-dependent alcohol dehydrogenase [Umezawaea tangerina]|uniref:NADPH:quinone reductase-like Zn-dependent oxidoreductase n=1 Tax=Umezawaea tangerina TaxID=84725 RepID=A0A2T0T7C9_9PSEU|nr:NAD(P)-dependent alcohol dehydrogenase [Umezawaea tangerina]PRY41548.1 NADPH:quinone reductase-like Zn-dependent oxidoreductase [Umezawaea tangerina]
MRAIQFDRFGPPEVLHLNEVATPEAGPGEVLVEVHGASVGGGETAFRAGKLRRVLPHRFPQGTGNDFAGRVASVGTGVDGLAVGAAVWGLMPYRRFGSVADHVVVPAQRLAAAPANVDLVEAAALPSVGTTAVTALVHKAGLRRGERLLVRGASGGVGSVAVQLGKALGAHVTALVSGRDLDWIRDLGADAAFDYRVTAPEELGRFDVVLDNVGTNLGAYRRVLTRHGRMVPLALDADHLGRSLAYSAWVGVTDRRRVKVFSNNPSAERIAELTRYVESGAVRPIVDTVFPMAEVAESHRRLEAGGVRGKYVISTRPVAGQRR